jgi:hypothetical protein
MSSVVKNQRFVIDNLPSGEKFIHFNFIDCSNFIGAPEEVNFTSWFLVRVLWKIHMLRSMVMGKRK